MARYRFNQGIQNDLFEGGIPREEGGEERGGENTATPSTPGNEMLRSLSKTHLRTQSRPCSIHTCVCVLLEIMQPVVQAPRRRLHPQTCRRIKKRKKEGGLGLPHTNKGDVREDRCVGAGGPGPEPRERCFTSGSDPVRAGSGVQGDDDAALGQGGEGANPGPTLPDARFSTNLRHIYDAVAADGRYNFAGARCRVPSGLNIDAWKRYLTEYEDTRLVHMLEFGWPINYDRSKPLQSTLQNHASATRFKADIDFYIATEVAHRALLGPFGGPPVAPTHISPLMTRHKKDSLHRRVIMDLSWPEGASVNEGVDGDDYMGERARIKLPTVQFMEDRVLEIGRGAFLYKTDLARGYRQLRVDPADWPILGFQHEGRFYLDICPPFGLKTSALFMQRTSEAISYIHGCHGFLSRPYLDDFGGAEHSLARADAALDTLQSIMAELGVVEATRKVCRPSQVMVWLGILFNTIEMTMTIPDEKMAEIGEVLREWEGKQRATQRDMQSLLGLLQFVASVSPPARIYTNRMLENLREAPRRGTETLSLGFKKDLRFFIDLWPKYNGVRLLAKQDIECQGELELDACLTGCGAYNGSQFYSERFPDDLLAVQHSIAHLELLNIVVAVRTWAELWAHQRVAVQCDNMNACLAVRSGRTRDRFMQACVRELFHLSTVHDLELQVTHCPGVTLQRADALSRAHTGQVYADRVAADVGLRRARQVRIAVDTFRVDDVW